MFALLVLELIGGLPKRLLRANVEVVRRARVHKLRPDTFDGHLGQHASCRHLLETYYTNKHVTSVKI